MSHTIPGAHSRHLLLNAQQTRACARLDDQGGENLTLTYAETSDGHLWPWIGVTGQPRGVDVEAWPGHELDGIVLPRRMQSRIRSTGHVCGAPAASTGRPCRHMVRDGGLCPQHAPTDDDCAAALRAFMAGYGYARDTDGYHLIYLDSGRRITFDTIDQLAAHCAA